MRFYLHPLIDSSPPTRKKSTFSFFFFYCFQVDAKIILLQLLCWIMSSSSSWSSKVKYGRCTLWRWSSAVWTSSSTSIGKKNNKLFLAVGNFLFFSHSKSFFLVRETNWRSLKSNPRPFFHRWSTTRYPLVHIISTLSAGRKCLPPSSSILLGNWIREKFNFLRRKFPFRRK